MGVARSQAKQVVVVNHPVCGALQTLQTLVAELQTADYVWTDDCLKALAGQTMEMQAVFSTRSRGAQ